MRSQLLIESHRRGHPFRSSVREAAIRRRKRSEDSDVKLFALSFTAFFICFYTFIA